MRKILPLALLACCVLPLQPGFSETPRIAPAPQCLDARQITDTRQPDASTLVIASGAGQFHRLTLAQACPGVEAAPHSQLLARDGWVCGGPDEYVQADQQQCPVATVAPIDGKTFAALAREADQVNGMATLDAVRVTGPQRGQGFRGSPSYCFAPRYLRSWSSDPGGLLVEVSRRHPGGHGWYRVELAGSCPELARSPEVDFRSRMDLGMICGNPGDVVVATARSEGFADSGLGGHACTVAAVYPIGKIN